MGLKTTFRITTLILLSIAVLFSVFTLVNTADTDEIYFSTLMPSESFIESYPPFIEQAEEYNNVIEEDGVLKSNNSEGYYRTAILKNEISELNTIRYTKEEGKADLTIVAYENKNRSSIIESKTIELKQGSRIEDLNSFSKAELFDIEINLEENTAISYIEIEGEVLEYQKQVLRWMFLMFTGFLLLVIIYIFYGIASLSL